MKKIVGYCRVSTINQKEEGTIFLQEKDIRAFTEKNNYKLIEVFKDEAVSGSSELENRPGLADLFNCLESNKDIEAVLIYKLDRLARDLYIQEHLIRKLEDINIELISIKEPNLDSKDPMRKAFRQFMGIVSELEKAFITMRLSNGRIAKAKRGGYAGGSTSLGFITEGKELKVDEEQARTVKNIFYLKRYKKLSLGKIAKKLNLEGVSTKRGGKFYSGTIKYILENPLYRGTMHYKDNSIKNSELALI